MFTNVKYIIQIQRRKIKKNIFLKNVLFRVKLSSFALLSKSSMPDEIYCLLFSFIHLFFILFIYLFLFGIYYLMFYLFLLVASESIESGILILTFSSILTPFVYANKCFSNQYKLLKTD